MYNHGLSTFVLGQAHGMSDDARINKALDSALKLIANTQCEDGGWEYEAERHANGHDLSLAVMQAKALRSAVDSGLTVPREVTDLAIASVREHYAPHGVRYDSKLARLKDSPALAPQKEVGGQFTYSKGGSGGTVAMAAAGVVCLQEFGEYDDWRIEKNVKIIVEAVKQLKKPRPGSGEIPFDALHFVLRGASPVPGRRRSVGGGLSDPPRSPRNDADQSTVGPLRPRNVESRVAC